MTTLTIPAPIKAGVSRTPRAAKAPTRTRAQSFDAWKSAQTDARTAVGYDNSSPIYGKTDLEVLQEVYAALTLTTPHNAMAAIIQELIKRKTAQAIASKTYRGKP